MTLARLFTDRHDYQEAYQAHAEKYGSCPIEDGTLGKLADNECPHGSLPADAKRTCECFPERGKQ